MTNMGTLTEEEQEHAEWLAQVAERPAPADAEIARKLAALKKDADRQSAVHGRIRRRMKPCTQ